MSINLDSNYSRILKTKEIIVDSITDNIATLQGGTLSNLYNPVNPSDVATKYYVDNFVNPGGVSLPIDSIQFSTGSSFIGVDALKYANNTMYINNKLSNGTILITDNVITNVTNPFFETSASNFDYLASTNMTEVAYSTTNDSNLLTVAQVVNKYLTRTVTNSSIIVQDIMPSSATIIESIPNVDNNYSFQFVYNYLGPATSILLYGSFIPLGNFHDKNIPIPVITVPANTLVYIIGTITDLANDEITYYIKNCQNMYSEPRITNIGLLTNNFSSFSDTDTLSSFIIYPLIKTEITDVTAHTYTYAEIRNKLIVRSGLTATTTDTFDILSTFTSDNIWTLGSGQIKFVIQNISNYDLIVGPGVPPTGWDYNVVYNRIIPSGSNGYYYINYNGSSLYLYTIGIYSRDG